jgi:hypothetical protein
VSDKETAPWMRETAKEYLRRLRTDPEPRAEEIEYLAGFIAKHAVECTAPAPQPSKEEAEIAVDKMFKNWLSRHCFFYANKTLRASGWREIAILLYRRSATPQTMPTCTCPCHTEKERCEQCCEYRGTSEPAPQELELEQESDGRWLAEFMRFPGVAAYGPSKEEAIRNAAKVLIESTPQVTPTDSKFTCAKCGKPLRVTDKAVYSCRCEPMQAWEGFVDDAPEGTSEQAPQVTPWKSRFTDSDVTGDIHNYVDTGDGKRLWAQDADEIVKRHNEGTSEQASPTEKKL